MRNYTIRGQEKTADIQLPSNPELWLDEIYGHISKMHPYLMSYLQGDIDWSVDPIDESEGNATGTVTALLGEMPIQIPIVVRNLRLKPVDIYLSPSGEMDYLNRDVVLKHDMYRTVDVGQRISPHDAYISNRHIGGLLSNKLASMMEKVADYDNFHADVKRVEGHVTKDYPELGDSFRRLAAYGQADRFYDTISVTSLEGAYKLAAFRKGYRVENLHLHRGQAFLDPQNKLAAMARQSRDGGAVAANRSLDKQAAILTRSGLTSFSEGDALAIHCSSGEIPGRLYRLGSLDDTQGDPAFLAFIGEDGEHLYPVQGAWSPAKSVKEPEKLTIEAIKPGMRLYMTLPSGALAGPFLFKGLRTDRMGERLYEFHTYHGAAYLSVGAVVSDITRLDSGRVAPRQYIIPSATRFIEAKKLITPVKATQDTIKLAEAGRAVELAFDGSGYVCRAGEEYILSQPEAVAILMSLGATEESARDAVKVAHSLSGERVEVFGLESPLAQTRGAVSLADFTRATRFIQGWSERRDAVTKLAAALSGMKKKAAFPEDMQKKDDADERETAEDNADEVDANEEAALEGESQEQINTMEQDTLSEQGAKGDEALQDSLSSINLINQYNAGKFSKAIPEIEEAKRSVASILYQIRTGEVEEIDEDVVKDGLNALESILQGLNEINAQKG
jgi:hypothetical protein